MPVCRYFQQGNCRYGNNCRFEHIVPTYNTNVNQVRQQQPQMPRQQPVTSNDFYTLVKEELELAEASKQWPLSCYCPHPSRSAALPGLDDYSPEELRCLMYEAQSSGNVEAVEAARQHILKLYQDAQIKKNIFKSQSPDCKAILERVRSGPASPSGGSAVPGVTGSPPNPFLSGSSSGSIFGGGTGTVQTPTNSFGGSVTPGTMTSSIFGGGSVAQSNPFGAAKTTQPSIFGGGAGPVPTTSPGLNPFGGGGGQSTALHGSPFGGSPSVAPAVPVQQTQGSIFGGGYSGPGQSSIFGQTPPNTGSIFGGGSSMNAGSMNSFSFAAAAQSQGFATPAPTAQIQPFSNSSPAPAPQPFSNSSPAPAPQPFMTAPPTQAQTVGSIFGGGTQPPVPPTAAPVPAASTVPATNPFGAPTQRSQPSQAAPLADSGTHTPLNELTEVEQAQFSAPTFSKGHIPLRPPPSQLCT